MYNKSHDGPVGTDCTGYCYIDLDDHLQNDEITIEEFLKTRPEEEWGFIQFNRNGGIDITVSFEFYCRGFRNSLSKDIYEKHKHYIIDGIISADGGWGRMDYHIQAHEPTNLKIDQIIDLCKSKQDCLTREGFCPLRDYNGCYFRNHRPDHWNIDWIKERLERSKNEQRSHEES